jgi:hypothetical protein
MQNRNTAPSEANDLNFPGNRFPSDKFIFRRLEMKRISISLVILCAGLVSVAWGQKLPCAVHIPWTEFHRTNMERWNWCALMMPPASGRMPRR